MIFQEENIDYYSFMEIKIQNEQYII